ncbi:Aste57867_13285 [Aphanomyces stellatus]|uniref:Aste57867_13285 protein n=1 Tax=Aphanomyces stellatus TaxID=120398 RepID=A0A485KYL1_9STRA|nr:hypothetical protein As57867_013236 [Aphanomyces stellatus]VFT90124.1 Aste57867_13285 [Aphanomyces stellatus]
MAYMQDIGWSAFYGTPMKLQTPSDALRTAHTCTEPGCNHCFEDAQSLKDHMTQHTWGPHSIQTAADGSKTFVCLNCGKGVTDRKVLRKHLLTHQEKRFLCSFDGCDKKFYERAKLKRHMLVHTGEKSFVCNFDGCGKQFAYKANLKTHLRTHTGLKPFACMVPGCNRTFAQASNRNSHMQTHNRGGSCAAAASTSVGTCPSANAMAAAKLNKPPPPHHPYQQPPHLSDWSTTEAKDAFMDQVNSVMGNMTMPLTAFKVPVVPVMPLPLQELLDESEGMYTRIPTPPFVRDKAAMFGQQQQQPRGKKGGNVPPLDLSMDALKSSELYSMLPTPGSFIGNSVFSFEA